MPTEKKIQGALYGVTVAPSWPDESSLVNMTDETDPPGYMIKMVLRLLYGKGLPQGGDKSEWALPLFFEGHVFLVTDIRRYKWRILGKEGADVSAARLRKKFIGATKLLNGLVAKWAKERFDSDDLFLQNHYYKTLALYEHFKEATGLLVSSAQDTQGNDPRKSKRRKRNGISAITDRLNTEIIRRSHAEYNLIATAVFFFALTEVVFDICFALGERRGLTYKKFRKLDWTERFKLIFDVSSSASLAKLYSGLIEVRRYYRNIPVHASPEFFFNLKGFGLVPSDYSVLESPHMLQPIAFEPKEAARILQMFDDTLGLFRSEGIPGLARIYAESGLLIPINQEALEGLKKHMGSSALFEAEMRKRADYQDEIDNMEV